MSQLDGSEVVIYNDKGQQVLPLDFYWSGLTPLAEQLKKGKFYLLSPWGCRLAEVWGFCEIAPVEFLEEAKIALLIDGREVIDPQEWGRNHSRPAGLDVAQIRYFPPFGKHRVTEY